MEQVVCGQVVCERKEEEALGGGGRRRRDTEPKTRTPHKDVGNNGVTVLPSASKNVSVCCSSSCLFKFPKNSLQSYQKRSKHKPCSTTNSTHIEQQLKPQTQKPHLQKTRFSNPSDSYSVPERWATSVQPTLPTP